MNLSNPVKTCLRFVYACSISFSAAKFCNVFFLFRPDGSERDAPLYNVFLFQRNREQDSSTPYAPYPFYSSLPGNQTIPLQFTPQAAPR